MTSLIVIPMAIFFAGSGLQIWLMRRIKMKLIDHHPDTWLAISRRSYEHNAIRKFCWRRQDGSLQDRDLSKSVRTFNCCYIICFGAWLCLVAMMFLIHQS